MKTKSNKSEETNFLGQSGQATLEWILVAKFMLLTIGGALMLGGVLSHKHWVLYNSQKALLCLAEGKQLSVCYQRLEDRLKMSFLISKIKFDQPAPGFAKVTVKNQVWGAELFQLSRSLSWPTQTGL